ncbi:hypothetical protein L1F28_25140 [Arthrospira platensis NCB002]|uniref:HAD family hydrolase n=1 Tax=Limnospira platensis TaxID=118562 RepID=UPI0029721D22|nr:hypothetical protein [Arthrospira platensis NCB002]
MKKVVFWDIDGTLLNTKGAGRLSMEVAIAELTGDRTDLSALNMAGLTDWDICSRILEKCNLEPTAENIEQLQKLYIKHLPEMLLRLSGICVGGSAGNFGEFATAHGCFIFGFNRKYGSRGKG